MEKKNQFNFDLEVLYVGGERARVWLAGRRPRAVIIGRFAILLHDVSESSFEELRRKCKRLIADTKPGIVPPMSLWNKLVKYAPVLNEILQKIGGEPLKDEDYVFVDGDEPVLLNPVTGEVGKQKSGMKLRTRPVVYFG